VLIAVGLTLAVGIGIVGIPVAGAFLEPFPMSLPGLPGYLTSSLVFDLGVFIVVIGLVSAALSHLGGVTTDREEVRA
jgi:multicomponent Na+:H+ antiporter subunit A